MKRVENALKFRSENRGYAEAKWAEGVTMHTFRATEGGMTLSRKQFCKEAPAGRRCLCREFTARQSSNFGQFLANSGNIDRFGEDFTVFVPQKGIFGLQKGRREVRSIGFDQKSASLDGFCIFDGFFGIGTGQGAAKRDIDILFGEGGEGIGGAGVGMEEEAGGMRGHYQQELKHPGPGIAAMEAGGQLQFKGQVELGAEDGFPLGIEGISHAGIEPDLTNAGRSAGELFAESRQPTLSESLNEPGVDAERAEDVRMGVGEHLDSGPVSFAGCIDMEGLDTGCAGSVKHLRQGWREARILQMVVGVEPNKFFTVCWEAG